MPDLVGDMLCATRTSWYVGIVWWHCFFQFLQEHLVVSGVRATRRRAIARAILARRLLYFPMFNDLVGPQLISLKQSTAKQKLAS